MNRKDNPNTNFDEIKDNSFEYHYSREERLRLSKQRNSTPQAKGLARLFGGDKMVVRFILFYIALGVLIWVYLTLIEHTENANIKKTYTYLPKQTAQIRFIDHETRHGINLSFQNRSQDDWAITRFIMSNNNWQFSSNLQLYLSPDEVIGFFIHIPHSISNLQGITFSLTPLLPDNKNTKNKDK